MNSGIARRTAVRSSTARSQGLRLLVIGAKSYYGTPVKKIPKFVFFRIASDSDKVSYVAKQLSAQGCCHSGGVCKPANERTQESWPSELSFFLIAAPPVFACLNQRTSSTRLEVQV